MACWRQLNCISRGTTQRLRTATRCPSAQPLRLMMPTEAQGAFQRVIPAVKLLTGWSIEVQFLPFSQIGGALLEQAATLGKGYYDAMGCEDTTWTVRRGGRPRRLFSLGARSAADGLGFLRLGWAFGRQAGGRRGAQRGAALMRNAGAAARPRPWRRQADRLFGPRACTSTHLQVDLVQAGMVEQIDAYVFTDKQINYSDFLG